MLTSRQIGIVKLLYSQKDFITIAQIAEQVGVSPKTVRNDLAMIKEYCQQNTWGDIIAKPHRGVVLQATDDEREHFFDEHLNEAIVQFPEADIRYTIIKHLLKRKTVTFEEIEKRLFVGRAAIEKELPSVQKWFQSCNILFDKKRGKGLEIYYSEWQYRMAVWQFASDLEKAPGDFFFEGFDLNRLEAIICSLEKKYGVSFTYEAHLQLTVLLALMIARTRKKNFVKEQKWQECKTDCPYDGLLADYLIEQLEISFFVKLPDGEKAFTLYLVQTADIQYFTNKQQQYLFEIMNVELCCITFKLANLLGEIINIDLKADEFFVESLMLQLRSTIQRLKYYIPWKHPLLKQVKQKYPNIFAAVYAAGVFFEKELGMEINEHEMCCLALHLGGALERNISVLTACVVCNYGLGVSQLLRERIERNITDLKIQGVFSVRDIRKVRTASCDFVISTLALEEYHLMKDVIVVEHLLTSYDMRQIGEKMKQIRKEKLKTKSNCTKVQLHKELFNKEFVWLHEEAENKRDAVSKMCRVLMDAGYVTEGFEASVFEHEEKAPTHLGLGVAIPHGYAKYVIRPVVAFTSVKRPVIWEGSECVDLIFLLAFNLNEASGLKEETIKFYSVFLDLMDSEEELGRIRSMKEAWEFAAYMNQKIGRDNKL